MKCLLPKKKVCGKCKYLKHKSKFNIQKCKRKLKIYIYLAHICKKCHNKITRKNALKNHEEYKRRLREYYKNRYKNAKFRDKERKRKNKYRKKNLKK